MKSISTECELIFSAMENINGKILGELNVTGVTKLWIAKE